jgi:Leucine Rich repeat
MVYHNRSYPLAKLAKNPSLGKLTHLRFHPHAIDDDEAYIREPGVKALVNSPHLPALTHLQIRLCDMGDKGAKTIAASGILKRLKVLDLQHGCVTDEGARVLAASPDLKNLELLDLTNNALTKEGIKALKATGVKVVAKNQWELDGGYEDQYLYAGDIE